MNQPYEQNLSTNTRLFSRNNLLRGVAALGAALLLAACGGQGTPTNATGVPGAVTPELVASPGATPDSTTEVPGAVTPEIEATTAP